MTIKGKVVIDLGSHKLWYGVSHVALTWEMEFINIGLKRRLQRTDYVNQQKNKKSKGNFSS